jgi:putative cell wall-binding protein
LNAAVAAEFDDDTFTDAPLLVSPQSGDLSDTDIKDRFAVPLVGDQLVTLTLTGPVGQDFDLSLYSPEVLVSSLPEEFHVVKRSNTEGSSTEAITYLVPPGPGGTYFVEVSAFVGASGSYTLTCEITDERVPRLFGPDRYRTSYAVSASTFAAAPAAVIASGANFPDALSAAGLAGAVNGPVLLAPFTTDPNDSRLVDLCREITRLGCTDVYIVGGEAAVSPTVYDAVADRVAQPKRISGSTRYQTAVTVADEIRRLAPSAVDAAFVVRGDAYPDALAVSPYAYAGRLPILLTRTDSLETSVSAFIESNDIVDVVIAGGVSAVDENVENEIEALNGATTTVRRLAGSNRVATAVAVAAGCVDRGWGDWERIGMATASNFPDALSGGFACGKRSGVLLLTESSSLSSAVDEALAANATTGSMVLVFGGEKAITDSVLAQIEALLP